MCMSVRAAAQTAASPNRSMAVRQSKHDGAIPHLDPCEPVGNDQLAVTQNRPDDGVVGETHILELLLRDARAAGTQYIRSTGLRSRGCWR